MCCDSFFLDEIVFHILEFGFYRTFFYHLLTMTEILLFKILYIYKFPRIAAMNQYFFANFVTFFNILVIFGFTIIRYSLKEHVRVRNYYREFGKLSEVYSKLKLP